MEKQVALHAEWLDDSKAFPFPDWQKVDEWITGNFPEVEHRRAYNEIALDWVGRIASRFPARMTVAESPNFILAVPEEAKNARQCLIQLEDYLAQIRSALQGLELMKWGSKSVVLIAPDLDSFTRYLADYYDDGEFMTPGGVCLRNGYIHFVLRDSNLTQAASTLAHELCHVCVTGIPWPLWVEEALVQAVEYRVSRCNPYVLDREMVQRHQRYWTPARIQHFWSGHSFHFPDEGSELSYHLARFLLEAVAGGGREQVLAFLRMADHADAGFKAMWETLGVFPSEILVDLLGPGDWARHEETGPRSVS
jgi:hypothetical protein